MDGLECIGLLGVVVAAIILASITTGGDNNEQQVAASGRTRGGSSASNGIADGKERTRPLPMGHAITHNDLNVTVLDVSYSSEQNGSFAPVQDDHVWAVVKLRLEAVGDPNKAFGYNTIDFRLVGDRGVVYQDWAQAPQMDMGSGEFFGGANLEATVVRQVHEDDENMVLIYSPAFKESRFFALESVLQNGSGNHTESTDSDVAAEENQQRKEPNSPPAAID